MDDITEILELLEGIRLALVVISGGIWMIAAALVIK